jgi:UDP-glucuronate decarboxylase
VRILVTGGAGFIGSHLSEKLIGQGHKVICVDDLSTGSVSNIAHLLNHPSFEFLKFNVVDPLWIDVDQIYNFASVASPVHYQLNPIQTTKTIVLGALNMLELAKRSGAKILQASTSEVYGDPEVHPQNEAYWGNVNPIGLRACYDEGKRCAETLFFDYWRQNQINIKVLRIFNTYGPRMQRNDGRAVSNFISQVLSNENITVYGDGSQTRSFCYVEDLVSGVIAFMNSADGVNGPMNLGNPTECSILHLATKIIEITGSKSRIVRQNLPSDDPRRRKPDIALAAQLIQWQPTTNLEAGLVRTIDYFRDAYKWT